MELIILGAFSFIMMILISIAIQQRQGKSLSSKFFALGDLNDKNLRQIMAEVGKPKSAFRLPNGKIVVEWNQGTYYVALLFNPDHSFAEVLGEQMNQPIISGGIGVGVPINFD